MYTFNCYGTLEFRESLSDFVRFLIDFYGLKDESFIFLFNQFDKLGYDKNYSVYDENLGCTIKYKCE